VLQLTATPFRRDGKLVDGKVIYSYPLQLAQRDGYFEKIVFEPVYEIEVLLIAGNLCRFRGALSLEA
jgi:superfamily II DNA or RNA helicase